jgi:hypothetical protein
LGQLVRCSAVSTLQELASAASAWSVTARQ